MATALAVANLYQTSGARSGATACGGQPGRVVGVAVGGQVAAGVATGADGGTTEGRGDTNGAGALVKAQRVCGHFVPCHCMDAELQPEDSWLQRLTDAARWLCGVYDNTIHQNNGTHLDGGIGVAEDAKWQRLQLREAACKLLLYDPLNGQWATWFLKTLTGLWMGVVEQQWNSECPLVFQACILQQVCGINRFHDVKLVIWGQLDAWDAGRYLTLVKAVEEANLDIGGDGGRTRVRREDTTLMARKYHNMVLGGKVRAAARKVTNQDSGGAYHPSDLDSKSGHPVINVLREKHPNCRVPLEEDFDAHPGAPNCLKLLPVYCFKECVAKAASRLSGSAGPCGIEVDMLKNWLLWHGAQSKRLCEVMATWVDWLSNGSPSYAA